MDREEMRLKIDEILDKCIKRLMRVLSYETKSISYLKGFVAESVILFKDDVMEIILDNDKNEKSKFMEEIGLAMLGYKSEFEPISKSFLRNILGIIDKCKEDKNE